MNLLYILKLFACLTAVTTGFTTLLWPRPATVFSGLKPDGRRGVTEMRVAMGALFLGLGGGALLLNQPVVYTLVGIVYAAMAVVRLVSMFVDRSLETTNYVSLGTETLLAVLLLLK